MGVRTKPLGAFDCDGCRQGWHLHEGEVDRCRAARIGRMADRVAALRRGASDVRFALAQGGLRRRIPPRQP